MMRVLVQLGLLFLVLECTQAVLLGSNRCTWGPSYWCSHIGTMKDCSSGSYCSRMWQRMPSAVSSSPDTKIPEDCSFCHLLASDLQRLTLDANRTSEESRSLATSACGLVAEPRHRSLCQAVVDNYIDEVTQLIRDGLTPDRLCTALSLCGGSERRRDPRLAIAVATEAPKLVRGPLVNPRLQEDTAAAAAPGLLLRGAPIPVAPLMLSTESARLRGSFCDICVNFVGIVKRAAANGATEAAVAQLMKSAVCPRMGGGESLCNVWIDSYVPEVMKMLANETNPRQICSVTKFCPTAAKYESHPLMQLMIMQKSSAKPLKDVECQLCEMMVSEARQMLRDNKTQTEIIEFIKNRVCSLVPAEKDKCIRAVTEYGPVIFQLLASELDPSTVCQALGACGKTVAATPRRSRLGPQCLLCEYVMREIDQLLGSNRTEAAIESALETVCSIMPGTVRSDCDAWVRHYTPAVLKVLSQDVSPTLVCSVLGLCVGPSKGPRVSEPKPLTSATACDVCQTVILYAKSLLKENATEHEVMNMLEKVCNFLPTQEQQACRSFVEQYTPYIIQLLMQDVNPKQICQTIGLCPKSSIEGSHRLRYRPSGPVRKMKIGDIDEPIV